MITMADWHFIIDSAKSKTGIYSKPISSRALIDYFDMMGHPSSIKLMEHQLLCLLANGKEWMSWHNMECFICQEKLGGVGSFYVNMHGRKHLIENQHLLAFI